jgi:hypothetical protein
LALFLSLFLPELMMFGTFAQLLGAAFGAPLFSTGNALTVRYFLFTFGTEAVTAGSQS